MFNGTNITLNSDVDQDTLMHMNFRTFIYGQHELITFVSQCCLYG